MTPSSSHPARLVVDLADALNAHDTARARTYLADDMQFVGVFGPPLEGADAYLGAMGKLGAHQRILKTMADDTDVCCFYELTLPSAPDRPLFGCGWFKVAHGRIHFIRVVFDPTALSKPS